MRRAPAFASFEAFRAFARDLLREGVPPEGVLWAAEDGALGLPLGGPAAPTATPCRPDGASAATPSGPDAAPAATPAGPGPSLPRAFVDLARRLACHRDAGRWALLYRLAYRLGRGERLLLDDGADDDVRRARSFDAAVRRDLHKMKAFVRFRRVGDVFAAWHRPDHRIVALAAPFFVERFGAMRWLIVTPDESAAWDGSALRLGPGAPRPAAEGDELEALWRTYYGAIFNPARLNVRAMTRELPRRHWATLPEASLIAPLIAEAPARVLAMAARQASWQAPAAPVPADAPLEALPAAAAACRACALHEAATQVVFGRGPPDARLALVGEQPGDEEDRAGEPFVGPAGRLLDDALAEAGLRRDELYLTNAVKHFKHEPRGKLRLHLTPAQREMLACRPWLLAELERVAPARVACLGATAARSLLGPRFSLNLSRGRLFRTPWGFEALATYHPAAILRAPSPAEAARLRERLVADLRLAAAP